MKPMMPANNTPLAFSTVAMGMLPIEPMKVIAATVVKLNTLPNTVRPPTQHHDLGALAHRNRVGCMVRGVVVGSVVNTTHSNRLIAMTKAQGPTCLLYTS